MWRWNIYPLTLFHATCLMRAMTAPDTSNDQDSPLAEKSAPWRPVRFWVLVRLLHRSDPAKCWHWAKVKRDGRSKLQVVSPRGLRFDFRLNKGAWLRPTQDEKHGKDGNV